MSKFQERKLLEKDEYVVAKAKEDELYELLKPWFDYSRPNHLKSNAPNGYEELLDELREIGQNVYYTEFMNGVAY